MNKLSLHTLVDALRAPEQTVSWSLIDWQNAVLVYRYSRLLASLKYRLEDKKLLNSLPEAVIFHLESAAVLAERQVQQVLFEVEEFQNLFADTPQIKPVLLKGAAYIANGTQNSKGRICSDIDLLVEHQYIEQAESMLIKSLWRHQEISDYDDKYYREFAHEIPPLIHLERATILDLHHNIYMSVSNRAPNIDLFMSHIKKSPAGLYTLTPAAAYVHSVIHLYLNEDVKFGLRDVYDQWVLCEEFSGPQFWQDCMQISQSCGFEFELMLSIAVIKSYFEMETPDSLEETFNKFSSSMRFKFWLAVYKYAFIPEHTLINTKRADLARIAVMLRGHWAKMPLPILIKHTSVKIYDFIFGLLAGDREKNAGQTKGL